MAGVTHSIFPGSGIPYVHRPVKTCRRNPCPIRGPGHSAYCKLMPRIGADPISWRVSLSFPYLNHLVGTTRGDVLSIRGPCHGMYWMPMIAIDELPMARCCIPDLYCPIFTC